MILAHERFLLGLQEGIIPAGKDAQAILNDEEAAGEDELDIIDALRSVSGKYDIEDFDRAKLTKHIAHDLKILKQIHQLVAPITPAQDAKLQTLKQWLAKPDIWLSWVYGQNSAFATFFPSYNVSIDPEFLTRGEIATANYHDCW
jgi:hypothetical protein